MAGGKDRSITTENADTRSELFELMNAFARINGKTEQFKTAKKALAELNREQDRLYKRDRYGTRPDYTEKDNEKMLDLYKNAISAITALTEGKKETKTVVAANRLNKILMRDRNHLLRFEPAEKTTFPEVLNNARSITVNTEDKKLSRKSGVQSTRIPMTITDNSGKTITGFFTPKSTVIGMEARFDKLIKDVQKRYPKVTVFNDLLEDFTKKVKEGNTVFSFNGHEYPEYKIGEDEDRVNILYDLVSCFRINSEINGGAILETLSLIKGKTQDSLLKNNAEAILYFRDELSKFYIGETISELDLRLEPGDRLDSRNAAMSTVATLLGRPDLICRAFSMSAVINGEKVQGTFMEAAKGIDIKNPTEYINFDPQENIEASAIRAAADLQIIDYICGNVDRHAGNMFYQFEEHGGEKCLAGIVGIDNDASFGADEDDVYENNKNKLVGTNNMRVISQSMAEKVSGLTEDMLRCSLRTYELDEDSIDAACSRLRHLQSCIKAGVEAYKKEPLKSEVKKNLSYTKNGVIRVVPDEQFKFMQIDDLRQNPQSKEDKTRNLFDTIHNFRINANRVREASPAPEKMKNENRFSPDGMNTRAEKIDLLIRKLTNATGLRGTSEQYEAMKTKLAELRQVYENTAVRKENGAEILPGFDCINPINKKLQEVAAAYKTYMDHKSSDKKPSAYARHRMELADEVLQFVKDNIIDVDKITEEEKLELHHNEEKNIENINRAVLEQAKKENIPMDLPAKKNLLIQ